MIVFITLACGPLDNSVHMTIPPPGTRQTSYSVGIGVLFQEQSRRGVNLTTHIHLVASLRMTGPGSVVGIATGYGLDGPGIESRWGRDFPHLSIPVLGLTQPPVQWVPGLSRG